MAILPVRDLGSVAVITDVAAYNVPISGFTIATNVKFDEGKVLLYAQKVTASHGIQTEKQDLRDEHFFTKSMSTKANWKSLGVRRLMIEGLRPRLAKKGAGGTCRPQFREETCILRHYRHIESRLSRNCDGIESAKKDRLSPALKLKGGKTCHMFTSHLRPRSHFD